MQRTELCSLSRSGTLLSSDDWLSHLFLLSCAGGLAACRNRPYLCHGGLQALSLLPTCPAWCAPRPPSTLTGSLHPRPERPPFPYFGEAAGPQPGGSNHRDTGYLSHCRCSHQVPVPSPDDNLCKSKHHVPLVPHCVLKAGCSSCSASHTLQVSI